MSRQCRNCGGKLHLNEDVELMECVECAHIEPINLNLALWNMTCPQCSQKGFNPRSGEAYLQVTQKVKQTVVGKDGKKVTGEFVEPVTKEVTGKSKDGKQITKKRVLVFAPNPTQKPVTCKGCGHSWMKKGAYK